MKNLYSVILIFFISLFSFGCAKTVADDTHFVKECSPCVCEKCPEPEPSSEIPCPAYDCRQCPDIDPYLEDHKEFWGSNSQMIYWGNKTLESLYARYDAFCEEIIENFKEDKNFIAAFKADIKAFKEYRDSQRNLMFPRAENYGLHAEYAKWASDYTITVQHIENLKSKIDMYCFHGEALLNDTSVCSDDNIDKIFSKLKLKAPKPVILTPYDKPNN